jgi:hypothetical protein
MGLGLLANLIGMPALLSTRRVAVDGSGGSVNDRNRE